MGLVYSRQREVKAKLAVVFKFKCFSPKMRDLELDVLVTINSETLSFGMKGFYKKCYVQIFSTSIKNSTEPCRLKFSKETIM